MSAIIPSAHPALMLSIEAALAIFMPPLTNINMDCSAKKPRTRLRSTLMRAA
jgi:hypothetical protein